MSDVPPLPALPAAERWAEQLAGWSIPEPILARAAEDPWSHDVARFVVDGTLDRNDTSASWAREVLPPFGGTVLDVGCGGGRSSLALVPPASELIGVDRRGAMLDEFVAATEAAGVARRTVHGAWPDVAPDTPIADVVVCHHVVYNVSEIAPFVLQLTEHARLAVVVELPTIHPMSAWTAAWRHFWGVQRPVGPTADDFLAVLRELGVDPEHTTSPRDSASGDDSDAATLVRVGRRRLCLPADRDDELAAWLDDNPLAWADTMMTVRWPGAAEPV